MCCSESPPGEIVHPVWMTVLSFSLSFSLSSSGFVGFTHSICKSESTVRQVSTWRSGILGPLVGHPGASLRLWHMHNIQIIREGIWMAARGLLRHVFFFPFLFLKILFFNACIFSINVHYYVEVENEPFKARLAVELLFVLNNCCSISSIFFRSSIDSLSSISWTKSLQPSSQGRGNLSMYT